MPVGRSESLQLSERSAQERAGQKFFLCDLDRKDTTLLKAIAIAAIVFHNFFHLVLPVHENEFTFDASRFSTFAHALGNPATAIQALFAFYGHFGVQIFIFLSAYGLAKSHWDDETSWAGFMVSRIKKLYPMFLLSIFLWAILAAMQVGSISLIRESGLHLILMLAGISTLVPGMGFPPVGPWWFIPFIIQFYAIWPLLRKLTNKFGWQGLIALSAICFGLTLFASPILMPHSIYLSMTPIGRMRILCLGIIVARYPLRINAAVGVPALAVFILGSRYQLFAHLSSLTIVAFSLWAYILTRDLLRRSRSLEQIGNYSLAIFLVNGIIRVPFIAYAKTPPLQLSLGLVSAVVTLAVSAVFHYVFEPATQETGVSAQAIEPWLIPDAARATAE